MDKDDDAPVIDENIPRVLRVKDPPKDTRKQPHPNLPQTPALLLMISPIRTGKSTILSNLILNSNFFGQEFFDEVILISPTIHNDKTSRFMKKCCACYDNYTDKILLDMIQAQSDYNDNLEDRPSLAIIMDDVIGVFKGPKGKAPLINSFCSRFRHYGVDLLCLSSQNYRKVDPVIRSNATNMIIGSPFPNTRELEKIAEEIGDQFGGKDNFLKIYNKATPNKYDFLHLNFQKNPPEAWHNFTDLIAYGGQSKSVGDDVDTNLNQNIEEKK
jgi:hypothetical protein